MTGYCVRLLIPGRFQNLKGDERANHGKEGGVHEHYGESLRCRDVDLRGGSGLDRVGSSYARQLLHP